jgi:hypothetical protein
MIYNHHSGLIKQTTLLAEAFAEQRLMVRSAALFELRFLTPHRTAVACGVHLQEAV